MRKATVLSSLLLLVNVVIVIVSLVGARAVSAQCIGPKPLLSELALVSPWRQYCYPPPPLPNPCTPPAPPILVSAVGAQEVQLQATVSDGFTASSAWWRAEQITSQGPLTVWEFESKSGILSTPGPYTVTFGAPGLAGTDPYYFRVSFTNAQNGTKLCYSDLSAASFTQGAFSSLPPAPPPTPVQQLVEDDFNRQGSTLKCVNPTGAGLGPNEVWTDCIGGQGGSVNETYHVAEFTPSGQATYRRSQASWFPSYSEMNVRVREPNLKYNLEVEGAVQPGTWNGVPTDKFYVAKLDFGPRDCTQHPILFLAKFPMEYGYAACNIDGTPRTELQPSGGVLTIPDTVNGGPKCNATPPLGQAEGGGETRSKPVWMRIETQYNPTTNPANWTVTGTVAWDCPTSGSPVPPIDQCGHVCTKTRVDTAVEADMQVPGAWGMGFHERYYHVEIFRAGAPPSGS